MSSPAEEIAPPLLPELLMKSSAKFWTRFLARFVDLIYGFAIGLVAGLCAGIVFGILNALGKMPAGWLERMRETSFHMYGFGILGTFLYFTFSEGICGTTIGKLVCGLSVVQMDGRRCTMGGAFKRDLAYHWDALFFGLVGYASMKDSPMDQRYGDVWARTVVVKKQRFTPTPSTPGWRYPLGIILGTLALLLCQVVGLVIKIL